MPYKYHDQLMPFKENTTIWRFMTFEHFEELITTSKMYFCKVGKFEDVFEGRYPIANRHLRPEIYKDTTIPSQESYDEIERIVREETFACCFHKSKFETAFMWKLYTEKNGVAIRTTPGRLARSLFSKEKKNVYISPIRYIDYNKDFLWEANLMYLAFHKRRSFSAEKELRALILDKNSSELDGIRAKVDLKELLNEVYISPYAPDDTVLHVQKLLLENNLKGIKVTVSDLNTIR